MGAQPYFCFGLSKKFGGPAIPMAHNKTTSLLQSSDKYGILGQWNELINCILDANGLPLNTTAVVNLAGQNVLDYFHRWTDNFKAKVYDSRIESAKAFKKAIEKCDPEKRPKVFVQVRYLIS